MSRYYISTVIIKGVPFSSNEPFDLTTVINLAREFSAKDYVYHISEEVGDRKYERRTLQQLEALLKETKK